VETPRASRKASGGRREVSKRFFFLQKKEAKNSYLLGVVATAGHTPTIMLRL
jgi:hypothetical protein